MALVVINSVRGQVGLHPTTQDVKAEAVAAILTDLAELSLEPLFGDKVVSDFTVVVQVLLAVVLHLAVKVSVQDHLVQLLGWSVKEDHVTELCGTGDRRVKPLAIHKKELPIEDGYFVADGRALEGVARATVAVDEVLADQLFV